MFNVCKRCSTRKNVFGVMVFYGQTQHLCKKCDKSVKLLVSLTNARLQVSVRAEEKLCYVGCVCEVCWPELSVI